MKCGWKHTFVVLAYKDSPYLESCIRSLISQTVKSKIILTTSTPSLYIENIARQYKLPVFFNKGKTGISRDWTFAYEKCDTQYLTLAHQDDLYTSVYTECSLNAAKRYKKNLIVFSDYAEIINHQVQKRNGMLNIKRLMLFPFFAFKQNVDSPILKQRLLCIGNPVCCPAVMYHKTQIGSFAFSNDFSMNLDWEALVRLACRPGEFVYINRPLIYRRIHAGSETTNALADQRRYLEDRALFYHFWPKKIADLLLKVYAHSYDYNRKRI